MEMENVQTIFDIGAWAGRQQAFATVGTYCSAAQAFALKQIRDTHAYEILNLTWETFCPTHAGISRERADHFIRQLEEFGVSYFNLSQIARISPNIFRQIADKVTPEAIEIDGEKIPLILPNATRIRSGLNRLRNELAKANSRTNEIKSPDITVLMMRLDALVEHTSGLSSSYQVSHRINELKDS